MSREAMKLALKAMTAHNDLLDTMYLTMDAVTALRAALDALDAPEPTIKFLDPNAWKIGNPDTEPISVLPKPVAYADSEQDASEREWQGLTDEEVFAALVSADPETKRLPPGLKAFARAIEAKLKEKNAA